MDTKKFLDTYLQREFLFNHKVFNSVENMKHLEWCANWLDNVEENFVYSGERIAKTLPFWKRKRFIKQLYEIQQSTQDEWRNAINELGKQLSYIEPEPALTYKKPIVVEGFKI